MNDIANRFRAKRLEFIQADIARINHLLTLKINQGEINKQRYRLRERLRELASIEQCGEEYET